MSDWFAIDEDLWGTVVGSRPPLFYFFDGYIDAGRVGATLVEALLEHSEPQLLGSFDWDLVHDYRARRPSMVFDTDHWVSQEDPVTQLHLAHDLRGRPYLVLRGPEPDHRWKLVRDELIQLIHRLGISVAVTGYGLPMTFPHTRPTPVAVHSTDPELRVPNPRWIDRLEIPASFAAYLEFAMGKAKISAYGVAAHVPHYLASSTFTKAAAVVMHRFAEVSELALPTEELDLSAEANLMSIDADTQKDETAQLLLQQLEEQYDRYAETEPGDSLPTADEIAAAVESFLAQRDEGNQPPTIGE
ncbi:MAG: PAC2 family protein [Propionibacteriaceae bacterium]|nr:PAC2 family protein [Propionibacteriaceae bacterium]